jgi:C1A family cysteine protease
LKGGSLLNFDLDFIEWLSSVEDQGQLGSCTAQAEVGVIEYYERNLTELAEVFWSVLKKEWINTGEFRL